MLKKLFRKTKPKSDLDKEIETFNKAWKEGYDFGNHIGAKDVADMAYQYFSNPYNWSKLDLKGHIARRAFLKALIDDFTTTATTIRKSTDINILIEKLSLAICDIVHIEVSNHRQQLGKDPVFYFSTQKLQEIYNTAEKTIRKILKDVTEE